MKKKLCVILPLLLAWLILFSSCDKPPAASDGDGTLTPVGTGVATPVAVSDIPAYNGTPFTVLSDNVPNFSLAELKSVGYERYGELDALGRVTVAVASLGKDTMPKENEERGDIGSVKPTGWVQKQYDCVSGKNLYNRSHLIGWQLSAENANKRNLITGTRYFNVEGMLPFENMVADYIKETENHVAYRVTPIFDGGDLLCRGVEIEAYSVEDRGEGIQFHVFCYNVQPGIVLDYRTGESALGTDTTPDTDTDTDTTPDTTPDTAYVWVPKSGGTKYHCKETCSGMTSPRKLTKAEAVDAGYTPCQRCY